MGWYASGNDRWRYRLKLTTDKTKVGADDTNFPVPVKATTTQCSALALAQTGGADFLFTNSAGTKLDHERISWDGTTFLAWVEIDAIDVDNDQTFYLYWGCPTCVDQQNIAGTWPTAYKFVAHMGDGTGQTAADATTLWLMKRRAIYFSGTYQRTYFVYEKYGTQDAYITYFDHDTDRWATAVKVDDVEVDDAHCSPTLAIDSSGYLYVFHGGYTGATGKLIMRKSTNVEDISAWDAAIYPVNSDMNCTYPQCLILSDGKMALFYRGLRVDGADNYYGIYRVLSTDSGATWGNSQKIMEGVATNDLPYFCVALGTADRVHLAYHYYDSSESGLDHDLYYAYSDDAGAATPAWKEIDGDTCSLPIAETAGNLVFNSDAAWDGGYIMGIVADRANKPLILYKVVDAAATDKVLCFEYSAAAWNARTVLESDAIATPIDANPELGDGSITIIGESVFAAFTVAVSAKDEIQEYESRDGGVTWAKARDITTGSSTHNSCPYYPINGDGACRLIWILGADSYNRAADIRYYSYTNKQARTTSTSYVDDVAGTAYAKKGAAEPATAAGQLGTAQNFDGTDDLVNAGTAAAIDDLFTSGGTVAGWLYTDSTGTSAAGRIADKTTGWMACVVSESGGSCKARFFHDRNTIDGQWTTTATDLPEGAWHHVVMTYDRSATANNPVIYIDASSKALTEDSAPSGAASADGASTLYIGNRAAGDRQFDGKIDEFMLVSGVMASTWVTTAYNSQAKPLIGEAGGFWKAYALEVNVTPRAVIC